jgi:hypothetical protein
MPSQPNPDSSLVSTASYADPALITLAHARYPGGVLVSQDASGQSAAEETASLVKSGVTVIYQAAVAADGMLAVLDVLVKRDGKWTGLLFRPSTKPKEKHFLDAAMTSQLWSDAGYPLDEIAILLLNSQYARRGELSPQELFIEERMGRRLRFDPIEIRGRMQMLKRMAAKDRQRAERGEVFTPGQRHGASSKPLTEKDALPDTGPVEIQVDKKPLREFLALLQYPLYFMDFEAYQAAIPEYDGHWPFRQLPYQFSVHRLDEPGGGLHHDEFIAPPQAEPTGAFGKALLAATGTNGSVVVYNRDSEQLILDQLEKDHPQWTNEIEALRRRLVDLMHPFSQQHVRIPSNGNKLSLKYVLPALVPEMSYAALTIGGGEGANIAYNAIRSSTDPAFIEATCNDLLEYCKLDTLAMVKILERLRQLSEA